MSRKFWSDEQLIEAVKNNYSILGVLRALGLKASGNYKTINKYIKILDLDISHFKGQAHNKGKKFIHNLSRIPLEDIMIKDSTYSRYNLKRRLIKNKILKYQCVVCGNRGRWLGKPVALILDHINGINNDHRLENLRLLCPMCNAQTETYCGKKKNANFVKVEYQCKKCGKKLSSKRPTELCVKCVRHDPEIIRKIKKNQSAKKLICKICGNLISGNGIHNICRPCARIQSRKVERPSYEQLIKEIEETNYCAVGRKYGVSDNAIRKWVESYEKEKKFN